MKGQFTRSSNFPVSKSHYQPVTPSLSLRRLALSEDAQLNGPVDRFTAIADIELLVNAFQM
jgi:hypothetical protein